MNETDRYDLQLQRMVNEHADRCNETRRCNARRTRTVTDTVLMLAIIALAILTWASEIASGAGLIAPGIGGAVKSLCLIGIIACWTAAVIVMMGGRQK